MSTDSDYIEYVHEQTGFGSRLTYKRMFGEYGLYLDGKVVAFACDNSLLLKPTEAGRALLPMVTLGKPYPEAKDYYVLDEFLDDTELLQRILQATADVLPAPKPKQAKKSAGSTRPPGKVAGKTTAKPAGKLPRK